MRKYEFRAKRGDSNQWLYGYYSKLYDKETNNIEAVISYQHFERADTSFPFPPVDIINVKVDEETVGQYTGLKDKNGVKIYEGDIIEHTISGNISVHEVYFDNEMLEFGLRYSGELFHCQFNDEFELVGNIHDNPELLNK